MARQLISMLHGDALSNFQPSNVSAPFTENSWVYYGQMSSHRI